MRNVVSLSVVAVCFLIAGPTKAQVPLETFFADIRHFVAADYSAKDLSTLKTWSDSSSVRKYAKNGNRHVWYGGKMITKEGAKIEFALGAVELKATGEKWAVGSIWVSHRGNCDVLLQPVLGYLPKYSMSFDTVDVKDGLTCRFDKIYLHFSNYSPSTNKVLESIDTSLTKLLKDEYFDFYHTDLDKKTSTWQKEFKTFMQPYSDALIQLLKKNDIPGIFKLIALKNKGYSWFLAEGLWYYNSLHPCLTAEQMRIVDAYNGKDGMIAFRPPGELKEVYKF